MIYIAHVLPLACDSDEVKECISNPHFRGNFHHEWPLNGWNDNIIEPARDTILEYYKVCA